MWGLREGGRQGSAVRMRLRIAAVIALAAGILFLPIEAYYRPSSDVPSVLGGWAIHTTLASSALIASYLALSPRQIDRLVVWLVLSHVANALLYMRLEPHNPALVASGLICLVIVGPVFFSWSVGRTAAIAGITTGAFAVVGAMLHAEDVRGGPVVAALGAL